MLRFLHEAFIWDCKGSAIVLISLPHEQRSFRAIAQHVSMESQDAATSKLTEKMQEILATGETVFPQD